MTAMMQSPGAIPLTSSWLISVNASTMGTAFSWRVSRFHIETQQSVVCILVGIWEFLLLRVHRHGLGLRHVFGMGLEVLLVMVP